jgi:hypothetical protein
MNLPQLTFGAAFLVSLRIAANIERGTRALRYLSYSAQLRAFKDENLIEARILRGVEYKSIPEQFLFHCKHFGVLITLQNLREIIGDSKHAAHTFVERRKHQRKYLDRDPQDPNPYTWRRTDKIWIATLPALPA